MHYDREAFSDDGAGRNLGRPLCRARYIISWDHAGPEEKEQRDRYGACHEKRRVEWSSSAATRISDGDTGKVA